VKKGKSKRDRIVEIEQSVATALSCRREERAEQKDVISVASGTAVWTESVISPLVEMQAGEGVRYS
jgi:hypothetical protein